MPTPTFHEVVFLVFDDVKLLDVSGPAEVLAEANRAGAHYRLRFVSPSGDAVTTSIGTRLQVTGPATVPERVDTLIVAGGDRLVDRPIGASLLGSARHLASLATRVASVCTGAFVLAQAGLLNGRRATTHWRHAGLLERAFPDVEVLPDAIYVADGDVFTSAGVSAGLDLTLALVEADHGPGLARSIARELVLYLQRPGGQSQYSAPLRAPIPQQPVLKTVVDVITGDPAADHTVDSLAAGAGVTARHLRRLFATELGVSPSRFVEQMRLDRARILLDEGHNVSQTARLAGFGSTETFRRVFVREYGLPPSRHQRQFGTAWPDEVSAMRGR
ncbi:GlxA family transcriptional regulator [Allonocardiopsis opalescens]|uniref:AraC family transcriptional regulator with amidase-like domain n=1 Tax=Allonocardiopsis opalescens TaxID=1144618 RepID=A0A2T0Q7C0_9ACTN|nr:GlxA family transcriptional regulator [Allonocardiopsis opalescens]PRX99730.1 AraC family transcriptional regulator with amidase-like domain [Allonocardiopsis opalescens]